jgi:hypothetical protein
MAEGASIVDAEHVYVNEASSKGRIIPLLYFKAGLSLWKEAQRCTIVAFL